MRSDKRCVDLASTWENKVEERAMSSSSIFVSVYWPSGFHYFYRDDSGYSDQGDGRGSGKGSKEFWEVLKASGRF